MSLYFYHLSADQLEFLAPQLCTLLFRIQSSNQTPVSMSVSEWSRRSGGQGTAAYSLTIRWQPRGLESLFVCFPRT